MNYKDIHVDSPPEDSIYELEEVMDQYFNRVNREEDQYELDEEFESLFAEVVNNYKNEDMLEYIMDLSKKEVEAIMYFKNKFERIRPSDFAVIRDINWQGDDDSMSTTQTYSYPSGHTAQAYYIAYHLSDKYPDLKNIFFNLAEYVAQSRVDRGVHYPSDLDAGRELAFDLYNMRKAE